MKKIGERWLAKARLIKVRSARCKEKFGVALLNRVPFPTNESQGVIMSRVFYYILLKPISLLPHALLYMFSDFLFLIVFHVLGYRKKVVMSNLKNSFPNKSEAELKVIMKGFYHHLNDLVVESLKGFSISEKELRKRVVVRNPELIDKFYDEGRSVLFVGGHYNNWEIIAQGVGLQVKHMPIGIYKPLHDKFLDSKMKKSREKFRLLMCSMRATKDEFKKDFGEPHGFIFGMDQSPSNPNKCYWMTFLNQDTPVFYGPEKYAKEYNQPVIYCANHKVKRGYYELEFVLITDDPASLPYGAITEIGNNKLEEDIIEKPEYWLWSHRRWKHQRPKELIIDN